MGDQGFQDPNQYRVAAAMTSLYREQGADAVIGLGDNIYQFGAMGPEDPQFETAFEIPYADIAVPFFMVLGNHDNGTTGNHFVVGNNEVAYHYRSDRTSEKWYLPSRFYKATIGHLELLVLDTNFLPSPNVPTPLIGLPEGYRQSQEAWLRDELAKERSAPWRLSASHHPIVTNYGADSDEELLTFLELIAGQVDVHLAGHDHTLQMPMPTERFGATEHVIVGASSFTTGVDLPLADHPTYFQNGACLGFAYAEFTSRTLTITFFGLSRAGDAEPLFTRTLSQPTLRSGPEPASPGRPPAKRRDARTGDQPETSA